MIEFVDYTSMMKLRRDCNLGTRNKETRAAANLYEKLRKLKMLDQLKQEAMTGHDKEAV
ncbi:hypothetical protein [Acinetobacter baumannii]|uniref:hypothetical protein n=1 Tax=Acinetobacter baumannii TaxID=470 RepID=UPI0005B73F44|nr:hypothetical protein [Acinetobacter baumannii]ALJ99121.1 hypothetical protein Ab1052phi_26 [Acinetobacter phage Ab105-2phi]QZI85247.1 hypothetical protein [Acinetobacter phage Ab105-2phideltaCI404ad]KIQ71764.1 hypothetical protein SE99_03473 [Acinetobacter baumannii]MCY2897983.1 hypothetical protein [Acinetobacter baumannii]MDN8258640.1 hypothetical protein [Acinetobacter baumannii]